MYSVNYLYRKIQNDEKKNQKRSMLNNINNESDNTSENNTSENNTSDETMTDD